MSMDFGANKTPVEVIKEGAFEGTYFKDIYSVINGYHIGVMIYFFNHIKMSYYWSLIEKNY